jgi:hypothetical protein
MRRTVACIAAVLAVGSSSADPYTPGASNVNSHVGVHGQTNANVSSGQVTSLSINGHGGGTCDWTSTTDVTPVCQFVESFSARAVITAPILPGLYAAGCI